MLTRDRTGIRKGRAGVADFCSIFIRLRRLTTGSASSLVEEENSDDTIVELTEEDEVVKTFLEHQNESIFLTNPAKPSFPSTRSNHCTRGRSAFK